MRVCLQLMSVAYARAAVQATYLYDQFSGLDRTADGLRCADACLSYLTTDNQPCLAYFVNSSRRCYLLPVQLSWGEQQGLDKGQLGCSL